MAAISLGNLRFFFTIFAGNVSQCVLSSLHPPFTLGQYAFLSYALHETLSLHLPF